MSAAASIAGWIAGAEAADPAAYPERPIRIVVPFAAGSQIDIAARLVGGKLAEAIRQQVVIENHPGASGNIGSELVAKAAPDGYTLLLTGSLITLLPSTIGSVAVDPIRSFAPITKLAEPPMVIVVHPTLNVSTLPELIELARQRRGKLAYATAGVGTVQHLVAWIITRDAGVEMLHIPYANSGQALKDVQSGEVPVYFTFLGPIDGMLRSGQLKPIAVVSARRMRAWPDIPTVVELGFREAAASPWNGVLAPAGTPPEIVNRLYREFALIVELPDVKDRFIQRGMEPIATPPDRFGAEIREAVVRWPPIVKAAGIRSE
ncbi:MAG TPA: tripartite tricarboxylate transporter substrate-binding protein [Casimicrobiaceae bacterium]|nr:tripartite tricarboxylate transporter substrate-binding protein [Casimicrobiaceae bacterium]